MGVFNHLPKDRIDFSFYSGKGVFKYVCKLNLNHFCWILRLFVLYSNVAKDVDKMQYFIFLSFFPLKSTSVRLWLSGQRSS